MNFAVARETVAASNHANTDASFGVRGAVLGTSEVGERRHREPRRRYEPRPGRVRAVSIRPRIGFCIAASAPAVCANPLVPVSTLDQHVVVMRMSNAPASRCFPMQAWRPGTTTRDRLVIEHVGQVRMLASRLSHRLPSQVEFSELVSVGVLGLIDAAGLLPPRQPAVPFDAFVLPQFMARCPLAARSRWGAALPAQASAHRRCRAIGQLPPPVATASPRKPEIAAALNVSEAGLRQATRCPPPAARRRTGDRSATPAVTRRRAVDSSTSPSDPGEGAHDWLERLELRDQPLARAPHPAPRAWSAAFWPSTTKRSSRWRKSAT